MLVVRHGQTVWNAEGRWQGWADIDLSDLGRAQAAHAALALPRVVAAPVHRVVSSDLTRARDTARALADVLGHDVHVDDGWRERSVGDWSGLVTAEIEQGWPGALDCWREGKMTSPPNGEVDTVFTARVVAALHRAIAATPPGALTLAVAHGGVIAALVLAVTAHERLAAADLEYRRVDNLGGYWFVDDGLGLRRHESVSLIAPEEQGGPSVSL